MKKVFSAIRNLTCAGVLSVSVLAVLAALAGPALAADVYMKAAELNSTGSSGNLANVKFYSNETCETEIDSYNGEDTINIVGDDSLLAGGCFALDRKTKAAERTFHLVLNTATDGIYGYFGDYTPGDTVNAYILSIKGDGVRGIDGGGL